MLLYARACTQITVDEVRKLFKNVKFSEAGSNSRDREENAYMDFLRYLDDEQDDEPIADVRPPSSTCERELPLVYICTVVIFYS